MSINMIDDNEFNLKSRKLFQKHKKAIPQARRMAKRIGHGYIVGNAIEKDSIHEAFNFFKSNLSKIQQDDVRHSVEYSVSSLVNTITLHVILKAIDMS